MLVCSFVRFIVLLFFYYYCYYCDSGALQTNSLKVIVLDDADELFSRGFSEQTYDLFELLPKNIQVCKLDRNTGIL